MNRYLIIDLETDTIISTSFPNKINDEEFFDRFGSSVSCIDKYDLLKEIDNLKKDIIEEYDLEMGDDK